jgi:hypothetical protein
MGVRTERAGYRLGGPCSEVVLRCFRTGGITHAGDRQLAFGFASYLIDVHKRKDNMRGKQGKESTRETRDVRQPAAAASAGGDEHDGVGHPGTGGVGDGRR